MRAPLMVVAAVVIASSLDAQEPTASKAAAETYEVASVKPNNSGRQMSMFVTRPGGRAVATNVTVKFLIATAYGLRSFQIANGPGWIDADRFDILATGSPQASVEQQRARMRALLADRFKLDVHRETRDMPIFALVLARTDGKFGPNLQRSSIDCQALHRAKTQPPPPVSPSAPHPCTLGSREANRFLGGAQQLSSLVAMLANTLERTVVDRTGLTGAFDFDVRFAAEQDVSLPSIFTAVQEQLGLKLESTRGAVEVLVIDQIEKPTPD